MWGGGRLRRCGTGWRRPGSWAQSTDHPGQRVVVVGHGGTVGASMVALGQTAVEDGVRVVRSVANASVTEWDHGSDGGWRMVRFNERQWA